MSLAAAGLVATAIGGTAIASAPPSDPATGSDAPAGEMTGYDESDSCGTDTNTSNIAAIQSPDPMTVQFTLCETDAAFDAKVAFSAFGIFPSELLEDTAALVESPVGTGPYSLAAWERGSQIVLEANPDYWGEPAMSQRAVFQWNPDGSQRLVQLESGAADGIDNVNTDDFESVANNPDLQLIDRGALNVMYLGFNVDIAPFDDPVLREAIAIGIDRQRIVDNFFPASSIAATQFLPPDIPGHDSDFVDFETNVEEAAAMIAEAYPDGIDVTLSYRDAARPYVPQPTPIMTDIQAQLADIGINATLDLQESGTFIDNANAGQIGFYMLGWNADYPDPGNFMDFHFGPSASPQFGTGFDDIHEAIGTAGTTGDPDARVETYSSVNAMLAEHIPMVPIAYGGSGLAYKAEVAGAHASPLGNENLSVMGIEGQDQFVFVQNGEPSGLYCADETDGESLRVCEQINESLLAYEIGGTEVIASLAEEWEANEDSTVWTFHLREGVTFHDGSELDATDVIESYRVLWDASDPRHVGRGQGFYYWSALMGGFLNPAPAE